MNAQINPNQMNPQMMARMNPGAMNASMNPAMNAGINPNQINSGQMLNQLSGNPGASGIPVQQQQMGGPNIMPNHNMTGMNQPNMAPNQMNAAGLLYNHSYISIFFMLFCFVLFFYEKKKKNLLTTTS